MRMGFQLFSHNGTHSPSSFLDGHHDCTTRLVFNKKTRNNKYNDARQASSKGKPAGIQSGRLLKSCDIFGKRIVQEKIPVEKQQDFKCYSSIIIR